MEQNLLLTHTEKSISKNKRTVFYIEMGILLAAIFARNLLEIAIPVSLILVLGSLIAG